MANKKKRRIEKALNARPSSRVDRELSEVNKNKMHNKKFVDRFLAGVDAQAARNIVIVDEEFAKNVDPASTKAAILARFAKRDAAFKEALSVDCSQKEVPEGDLVGNLDL